MKIEGSHRIAAPRDVVWKGLLDPAILARAVPGCEKLEAQPDGSYRAEMSVGIAAIKGRYHGRIEILDPAPPEHYRMKVEGQGTGGFVRGEGVLTLIEEGGGTLVSYSGESQVGGIIANVGQRLLQGAARQVVSHFFDAFAREIVARLPTATATSSLGLSPTPAATVDPAAPAPSPALAPARTESAETPAPTPSDAKPRR